MSDDNPNPTSGRNPLHAARESGQPPVEFLKDYLSVHSSPGVDARTRDTLASIGAIICKRDAEQEALAAAQAEAAAAQAAEPAPPTVAQILQFLLPFGEDTRAVSNAMARCALFAPVKERERFGDYVVVGKGDGCLIEWRGEQLNQDDHDTFMQLVQMARLEPLGTAVTRSVNAILDGLGRHTRQEQRRQLFEQCGRLKSGTLRITPDGKPAYVGSLILEVVTPRHQPEEPRHRRAFTYRINPQFASFYGDAAFTLIDWGERFAIRGRGSELAKWLHLWASSHAEQYPHKVETIRERCGSKAKNLKHFREKLRQALDLLKGVEIEKFPTRDEALLAERAAIINEAPLYNIRLSATNRSRDDHKSV